MVLYRLLIAFSDVASNKHFNRYFQKKTEVPFLKQKLKTTTNMRQTIYWISVLIIFTALIAGIDSYFGPEIRKFSIVVFFAWITQTLTGNWKEIKAFLRALYGLDKK